MRTHIRIHARKIHVATELSAFLSGISLIIEPSHLFTAIFCLRGQDQCLLHISLRPALLNCDSKKSHELLGPLFPELMLCKANSERSRTFPRSSNTALHDRPAFRILSSRHVYRPVALSTKSSEDCSRASGLRNWFAQLTGWPRNLFLRKTTKR